MRFRWFTFTALGWIACGVVSACAAARGRANDAGLPKGTPTEAFPGLKGAVGATAVQPSPIGRMELIPEATYWAARQGELSQPREVRVEAFEMDATQVTVAQYASCVRAGACPPSEATVKVPGMTFEAEALYRDACNGARAGRGAYPENCLDWEMASRYCAWAGKRLPTDEEWEYASCGDEGCPADDAASSKSDEGRWVDTGPVAQATSGRFGLYDMPGELWEWTASPDCAPEPPGCRDPRRVIRGRARSGGDFLFVRLGARTAADPSVRLTQVAFRCARSLPR